MWILWLISGIVGGVLLIVAAAWASNNIITTTRYRLDAGLEKPVKIVQVSDLHGKAFGRHNSRLIAKINGLEPDLIAITGDIIHKYRKKDVKNAVELVSALSAAYPVVFAAGNHELRSLSYRAFRKELQEAGARVLDDCPLSMLDLTVVGLKCSSLKNGKISDVAKGVEGYKIALAHMPQFFDRYVDAGYDLVLSGHAHGGQWRIPFIRRGVYAPGQGLFPKYCEGLHKEGKTTMIVSRGLGNSEFPLRLNNLPELVIVELA